MEKNHPWHTNEKSPEKIPTKEVFPEAKALVHKEEKKIKGTNKLNKVIVGISVGVMLLVGADAVRSQTQPPEKTHEKNNSGQVEKFGNYNLKKYAEKFNVKLVKYFSPQNSGFEVFYDGQKIGFLPTDSGDDDENKTTLENILVISGVIKKELKKQADEVMARLFKNDSTGDYTYSPLADGDDNLGEAHLRYKISDKNGKEVSIFHLIGDREGLLGHFVEKRKFKLEINSEVKAIMKKFKMRLEGNRLYLDLDPFNKFIHLNEDGQTKKISFHAINDTTIELNCENADDSETIVTITNGASTSIK